jgi:hypothetical protein
MAQLSQLPDDVDLSFVAGDTFRIRIRVIDPADSSAEPLAGYSFCAQIVKDPDRSFAAEFTITDDPDNPTEAKILTLPPTETAVLPGLGDGLVFNGLWDLQVTFPSPDGGVTPGDIRTVAKGSVTCYIDISCTTSVP